MEECAIPDKFGYPMFGSGRVPVASDFDRPPKKSGTRNDRVTVATFGKFLG